jgi:hypothetical protein
MQDNQRKAMFAKLNTEQGARQSKGSPYLQEKYVREIRYKPTRFSTGDMFVKQPKGTFLFFSDKPKSNSKKVVVEFQKTPVGDKYVRHQ